MRLFSTIDPGCIWITLTEYSASVYWIYTEQPSAAHCCLLRAFSRVKELIAVVKDSPRFPLFTQDVVVPHTSSVPPFRANSHGLGLQQRSRASNIGHRLKSLYSPPTPPDLHSSPSCPLLARLAVGPTTSKPNGLLPTAALHSAVTLVPVLMDLWNVKVLGKPRREINHRWQGEEVLFA